MSSLDTFLQSRLPAKRSLLYLIGALILLAGLTALLTPLLLYASVTTIVGVVLLVAGTLKAVQFLLGLRRRGVEQRGFLLIGMHVLLDIGLGVVLLTFSAMLGQYLRWLLFAMIIIDGR